MVARGMTVLLDVPMSARGRWPALVYRCSLVVEQVVEQVLRGGLPHRVAWPCTSFL
jgi:hypothetical protein